MEDPLSEILKSITPESTAARKLRGEPLAVLTAYDYPSARLLEEAGVDWILVGDSLGMVVLGYPDTTHVTLADMVHHTTAVARGLTHTPIITDLPIGTYDSPEAAIHSARALIHAGAHAVKLEGGASHADRVRALAAANIPVMGHIGMLPQSVLKEGGYRTKGKTPEQRDQLVSDALALEAAGAFALIVELVQPETTQTIQKAVRIPIIGIGAGSDCDGQVLVTHDLIGAFPWFRPKFVTANAAVGEDIKSAVKSWIQGVKPSGKHLA
jgi:3-methyl-2-oxobutanoate hydroxymethyltransferase